MLKIFVIFLLTSIYTFVRYVIFGGVDAIHIPVYLLNKSFSMAATIFIFLTILNYYKTNEENIKTFGKASLHFSFIHIMLSVSILSKAYYPKFFMSYKMNLIGVLVVLTGVLTAYLLKVSSDNTKKLIAPKSFFLLINLFLGAHLFIMGFKGWLTIGKWHGSLPPISLVSFLFIIISLHILFFMKSPEKIQNIE